MSDAFPSKPVKVAAAVPLTVTPTRRPINASERLARALTRPHVASPLVILSLALLGWSFLALLATRNLAVHARPAQPMSGSNTVVTAETVAELEGNARSAAQQLIREREVIARALSRLEQQARALGFQVEVSMKPALTNAAGFKELTIHPAVISLENDYDRDEPAFLRLLTWLRQASQGDWRIEVAALSLRSKGNGLARAQVELHFWSIDDHEKSVAK